jgi:hypothetical protein
MTARKKRKSPDGTPTNDLVFSAYVGTNDEVFPFVLSLYVEPGSTVADVTYGKGVFWRNVPPDAYKLLATDLQSGVDCRSLPYQDGSIDPVRGKPRRSGRGRIARTAEPSFGFISVRRLLLPDVLAHDGNRRTTTT